MKHDNRTQKRTAPGKGLLHTLFAKPKRLPATATQEHDWDSDVPSIKLSTAFMVILFLHVAVVGGVMLFRFLGKDSEAALAGYESQRKPNKATAAAAAGAGVRLDDPAVAGLPRHIVKAHETLEMIASAHGVSREALSRTNGLSDEKQFREGVELVIPPRDASAPARIAETTAPRSEPRVAQARPVETVKPATPVNPPAAPRVATARAVDVENATTPALATTTATAREHTVKSGETVWGIAKQYGVSADALLKANNISDAKKVRLGAKLKVPSHN